MRHRALKPPDFRHRFHIQVHHSMGTLHHIGVMGHDNDGSSTAGQVAQDGMNGGATLSVQTFRWLVDNRNICIRCQRPRESQPTADAFR